jgi:hypothetical protein
MQTLPATFTATDTAVLDTVDCGVLLPQTVVRSATAFALATLCPRCGGPVASDAAGTVLGASDARWHPVCARLTLAETPDLRRALRALVTRLMDGALGDYSLLLDEVLDGCAALAPCDDMGLPVSPAWDDAAAVGAVSGPSPAQIMLLSDLVCFLQAAGWKATLHPDRNWATFRHDAQPVSVLLPQHAGAPGAATLLSGALATLAALAGCSGPAFVAMLTSGVDGVAVPSAAMSSAVDG